MLDALQRAQNSAARAVTKLDWNTPTTELLKQCGWLSVNQLVVYYSVVQVYKTIQDKSPSFLYSMFSAKYNYNTKHALSGSIKHARNFRLDITESSFRWRATSAYNELPQKTKEMKTLKEFKTQARKWVKENTPLE